MRFASKTSDLTLRTSLRLVDHYGRNNRRWDRKCECRARDRRNLQCKRRVSGKSLL